jgi:hypothetical protein
VIATPRIKSHWFKDGAQRDAQQVATAAAAAVWRTANHRIAHMRSVGFAIDVGEPYVGVLAELLAFLVAVADRVAYAHDPGEWRTRFTTALAIRVAELFQECFEELLGRDAARGFGDRFVERANERFAEYAAFGCDGGEPDFGFLRRFGNAVGDLLAAGHDRRWGADQAMSVEGPAAAEAVARAMRGLLGEQRRERRASMAGE